MKLFKRKSAIFQDYVNFIGMILFIYVIATKTVLVGNINNLFVMENAVVLTAVGILLEMLFINLSFFITDFKNWMYDRSQNKKYGKRKDNDEKEES